MSFKFNYFIFIYCFIPLTVIFLTQINFKKVLTNIRMFIDIYNFQILSIKFWFLYDTISNSRCQDLKIKYKIPHQFSFCDLKVLKIYKYNFFCFYERFHLKLLTKLFIKIQKLQTIL